LYLYAHLRGLHGPGHVSQQQSSHSIKGSSIRSAKTLRLNKLVSRSKHPSSASTAPSSRSALPSAKGSSHHLSTSPTVRTSFLSVRPTTVSRNSSAASKRSSSPLSTLKKYSNASVGKISSAKTHYFKPASGASSRDVTSHNVSQRFSPRLALVLLLCLIAIIMTCQARKKPMDTTTSKYYPYDEDYFDVDKAGRDNKSCVANLITIDTMYCTTERKCKATAGKLEYWFHLDTGEIVDKNLWKVHKNLPISYKLDGQIYYSQYSFQWARQWLNKLLANNQSVALANSNSFNWCDHVPYWPVQSVFTDRDNKYAVYWYNRQSCIIYFDGQKLKRKYYHNRFSDMIDTFELRMSYAAAKIPGKQPNDPAQLFKYSNTYHYLLDYKIITTPKGRLWLTMEDTNNSTSNIDDRDNIIPEKAMKKHMPAKLNNICLDELYNGWPSPANGFTRPESVDLSPIARKYLKTNLATDHTREPVIWTDDTSDTRWYLWNQASSVFFRDETFVSASHLDLEEDGEAYDFFTTVPLSDTKLEAHIILKRFRSGPKIKGADPEPRQKPDYEPAYDDRYPRSIYRKVKMELNTKERSGLVEPKAWLGDVHGWSDVEKAIDTPVPDLNQLDDIAYLYKCKSVIAVFGPFFQEYPADQFHTFIEKPAKLRLLTDLQIYEPVSSLYSDPDSDTLYAVYRRNYVQQIRYSCAGQGDGRKITGSKVGNLKFWSVENKLYDCLPPTDQKKVRCGRKHDFYEEKLFAILGLVDGQEIMASRDTDDPYSQPKDPNPEADLDFLNPNRDKVKPSYLVQSDSDSMPIWLILVIALVVLLLISAMLAAAYVYTRPTNSSADNRPFSSSTQSRSSHSRTSGVSSMRTARSSRLPKTKRASSGSLAPSARSSLPLSNRSASRASQAFRASNSGSRRSSMLPSKFVGSRNSATSKRSALFTRSRPSQNSRSVTSRSSPRLSNLRSGASQKR
ncbi:hypothetical protein GZH46_00959, partial [Fragariocoptes setiger]